MAHLGLKMSEVGLMRYGWLLDMLECWLQETGRAKRYEEHFIDDIIPLGI